MGKVQGLKTLKNGWVLPQQTHGLYSTKSDVYSFGVLHIISEKRKVKRRMHVVMMRMKS